MVNRTAIKAALAKIEAKQQDNRSCQALMKSMGLEQFDTHESDARMMRTPKGRVLPITCKQPWTQSTV